MAETKIPNSEDLFEIYKSQLELVNDINKIIVKNKMDKTFFVKLKKSVEYSTDTLETVLYGLERISTAYMAVTIRSKDLKDVTETVYAYQDLITAVGSIPMKTLVGGKVRMMLLRRNLNSTFKFIERLGGYNPIAILKARMSLKQMEPIMESLEILSSPLRKLSIRNLISYRWTITKYKMLFQKICRLMEHIGDYKLTAFTKAKLNVKFISDALGMLPAIFEILSKKITFKQIMMYRRTISKLYVLLFGRIYDRIFRRSYSIISLIEKLGDIDMSKAIKAKVSMFMIMKTFKDLNETLLYINDHMSWLEKNSIQTNINRTWLVLFGEEYGWIGRNIFRRTGHKKRGVMDLVVGITEALTMVDSLKAAAQAVALVVFVKALNVMLRGLTLLSGPFGRMRKFMIQKGIKRLYIVLFGRGDKLGNYSLIGMVVKFGSLSDEIRVGFETMVGIVETMVDMFRYMTGIDLKSIAISKTLIKTFIWDVKKLIKIVKLLTDKKSKVLEKSEDAIKVIDNMKYIVDKFTAMVKAAPNLAEQIKFGICLTSMYFAIIEYSGLLKLAGWLKGKSLTDEAFTTLQSVLNSISDTVKKFSEAAKAAPPKEESGRVLVSMVVMIGAVLLYSVLLKTTEWFMSKGLISMEAKPGQKSSAQIVIASMAATLKDFTEATKNSPDLKKTGEITAILASMMVSILLYEGMLWTINFVDKKLGGDKRDAQRRAAQICKDMASTMLIFGEAIEAMPKRDDLKDSAISIVMMMAIMTGMVVVMHIVSKSNRESRRANRAAMLMRMVLYSIVVIALAVIGIGAMVVIGAAMISVAIGFIAGVLALMVLLSLGRKFLKSGALALLVVSMSLAIMTLIMYALVELSEKADMKKLWATIGTMVAVVIGITVIIFILGAIMKTEEGAVMLAEGAVSLIIIAGVMWAMAQLFKPIARIAVMTKDADLAGTVDAMIKIVSALGILMLGLGGLIFFSGGAGAIVLAIGAATVLAIGGIIWALAKCMEAVASAAIAWHDIYNKIPGLSGMNDEQVSQYLAQMMLIPIAAVAQNPYMRWDGKVMGGSILDFLAKFDRRTIKDAKKTTIGLSSIIEGVGDIAHTMALIPPYQGDAENFQVLIESVMGAIINIAEYFDNDAKKARKVKRIFRNMKKTIASVGDMAKTMMDVAYMRFPVEIDEKTGRVTKYQLVNKELFEAAGENISTIITSMVGVFSLFDSEQKETGLFGRTKTIKTNELDDIKKRQIRKVKKIMELSTPISGMVDTIIKLSKLLVPFDENSVDQKTGKITKWKVADAAFFSDAATNVGNILTNYIKAVDIGQETGSLADGWNLITAGNKRRANHIKTLIELTDPISKLVDTIIKIKSMKVPVKINATTGEVDEWKLLNISEIEVAGSEIATFVKKYVESFDLSGMDFGQESFWDKVTGTQKNNEESVKKIMEMSSPINALMDAIIKYKSAKYPTSVDADGNPTGWVMLKDDGDPTGLMFSIIGKFVTGLTTNTALKDAIKDQKSIDSTVILIKSLGDMAGPMDKIVNTLKSGNDIKFVKVRNQENTPAGHAIELIAKSIFQNVNGSNLNQRTSAWKQATDDSVKLIKSVNTLDISKVNSLRDLMHELYLFSDSIQGNFDKLADVINEKLLTVLEKLAKSMDDVANTSFTGGETGETPAKWPRATHNDDKDKQDKPKENPTKKAMDQLQSDMNSLKSLINEISRCIDKSGTSAFRIVERS